jgi:predicted metal-binding protein
MKCKQKEEGNKSMRNSENVAATQGVDNRETGNQLKADLEALRLEALARGADDAVVIPISDVIIDPRVRFKCMIPKCYMSGNCAHCPPHGYSLQDIRDILGRSGGAVFFKVGVKSSVIAAEQINRNIESGVMDDSGNAMNLGGHYMLVFTIVKILQKRAAEKGYGSHGFAAGNCRDPFCHMWPFCQDLMTDRGCRHPNLSANSMESCGMDVFRMAACVGWQQYPIGGSCVPESVPRGNLMGLVLIGDERQNRNAHLPMGEALKVNRPNSGRRSIRDFRKNMQALKQWNVTVRQMLNFRKEAGLWFQVTKNFRELEGSWRKAFSRYDYISRGVPQKNVAGSNRRIKPTRGSR